ncbi:MAG: DUF502 domain-containing protein [Salinivirgaceae bacterium]|nr:DUF502 domain-containing protein [Salinivirgaceae bacterium]MDD4747840.1 DUF502 domain-containing protein [Salinivirgaceae bacterium]MDY0280701.1 DUF502 domain-containing protein [Salinivirgaceae bacterium]
MKKIVQFFAQGLIFVLPLAITFYLIYFVFTWLDNIIPFKIPGIGLLVIITGITLVGFLFQILVATPLYSVLQNAFNRAPLLKVVYSSIKDLFSAFVGKERKFDKPVIVTIDPVNNIRRVGFETQADLTHLNITEEFASVYFPSSYGILGELYIVPKKYVTDINAHPAEVMKFIVSGGVSSFENKDLD